MKKWYVMCSDGIDDATINWKPVDDVKFAMFENGNYGVAVVFDKKNRDLIYMVHPSRVKCVEVKD